MFEVSDNSVIGLYAQQRRRSKALNITFWVLQSLAAVAFLIAGATAVEVGTATFWDPRSPLRIARELARFLKRERVARVGELVDTLKL